MASKRARGFFAGASALAFGFRFLARRPGLWPAALVPAAIASALAALGVWAALALLVPHLTSALPPASSWYGRAAARAVAWGVGLGVAAFAVFLAVALAPPLSGPALERIVAAQEGELGAPPRSPLGWFSEMVCGARAAVFGALFVVPAELLLWVADLVVPGAAFVTPPLKVLVAGFGISWNLIDYSLTLRGVRMRERFALVRQNWRAVLGFGVAFAALFWVPCCGLLLLGVGVAAGTRLVWTVFYERSTAIPS
jgi:CysZ protein